MENIAIALCGGGGKGAFQIGALKYFQEQGLMENVKAISGSSVGALNAVLFALGNYNYAEKIWKSIHQKDILLPNNVNEISLRSSNPFSINLFRQDKLKEIIEQIPLYNIQNSPIDIYVAVTNTNNGFNFDDYEYIHINKLPLTDIVDILLAATSMPILYEDININGINMADAGTIEYGNTPIEPLCKNGYNNIYVISLDSGFSIYDIRKSNKRINAYDIFPQCTFNVIRPLHDLGGLEATLDFSQNAIRSNLCAGYIDTKKTLNNERVSHMRNNEAINIDIDKKMRALFNSSEDIDRFIKLSEFSSINIVSKTMGGKTWWKTIVEMFGWKVQQHIINKSHYRIINSDGIRYAYTYNPQKLLEALEMYEVTNKDD